MGGGAVKGNEPTVRRYKRSVGTLVQRITVIWLSADAYHRGSPAHHVSNEHIRNPVGIICWDVPRCWVQGSVGDQGICFGLAFLWGAITQK